MIASQSAPQEESVRWSWRDMDMSCGLTRYGTGPTALLLPALSSISSRREMLPLQQGLGHRFETVAPDWPGFGDHDKPAVSWTPHAMEAWLDHLLRTVAPQPALVVAPGHAASLVVRHFAGTSHEMPELVLVAPTWRGPLPTMMGRRPGWLARVRAAFDNPLAGPLLYALNLNRVVIRRMAKGHVYSDPGVLTSARLAEMRQVVRAKGARFASVRFVTGALDPYPTGEEFRAAVTTIPKSRVRLLWGDESPRKSKADMVALAETAGITPRVLPQGKLGVHEEFASEVAEIILTGDTATT